MNRGREIVADKLASKVHVIHTHAHTHRHKHESGLVMMMVVLYTIDVGSTANNSTLYLASRHL